MVARQLTQLATCVISLGLITSSHTINMSLDPRMNDVITVPFFNDVHKSSGATMRQHIALDTNESKALDFQTEINTMAMLSELDFNKLLDSLTENNTFIEYREFNSTTHSFAADATVELAYLGYVLVPVLLLIGVPSNILTAIVMASPQFRNMSTSVILTALSVSDSILLLMVPFNKKFTKDLIGVDVRSLAPINCKIFYWVWRTAKFTSSWFVVLATFERVLAVWVPFKVKNWSTRRKAFLYVSMVYALIGGYNLFWAFFTDTLLNGTCMANMADKPENTDLALLILWGGASIYCYIPTALLLVMTPMIILKLHLHKKTRKRLTEVALKRKFNAQQAPSISMKTTLMVLNVAIAFIVLVVPIASSHLYTMITGHDFFHSTDLGIALLREIVQICEQLNYSINFYVFVIWNNTFRSRLRAICCGGRPCCRTLPDTLKINRAAPNIGLEEGNEMSPEDASGDRNAKRKAEVSMSTSSISSYL